MSVDPPLPSPTVSSNNVFSRASIRLFRASTDPNNSLLIAINNVNANPPNPVYGYLPYPIPQSVLPSTAITKYVSAAEGTISILNGTEFYVSGSSLYTYDINLSATSNINGVIIIQLVDGSDIVYNSGAFEIFSDVSPLTKTFTLRGSIYQSANSTARLRITGYDPTSSLTNMNISISQLSIIVTG